MLFSRPSLFAMPSVCEPFGLVLVEAMSHGLPVIDSTADAMAEIVEEAKTGFLVSVDDAEALADRLACLLSSPRLCEQFGQAGRERVEREFLWSQVVGEIEDGLRDLCREE
jgi:glycosyltransferase involved in cell wall biosynthesis